MKHLTIILAFLIAPMMLVGQTWEPAVRLEGVYINLVAIQHPDGPVLLPIQGMPGQDDVNYILYDVKTLSMEAQPFEQQLNYKRYKRVGDFNGNGLVDVYGTRKDDSFVNAMYMDVFTESQVFYDSISWYGPYVTDGSQFDFNADLDSDGYLDVATARQDRFFYSWGAEDNSLTTRSTINIQAGLSEDVEDELVVMGLLDGKPMMVRLIHIGNEPNMKLSYQLLSLRQEDIQAHRDTIRTDVVFELPTRDSLSSDTAPVLRDSSVWWLGSISFGDRNMLRITSTKIEVVEAAREWATNTAQLVSASGMIGQRRRNEQIVVVDPKRPVLYDFYGFKDTTFFKIEYTIVIDTDGPRRQRLGLANILIRGQNGGSVRGATLIPDIDEDGMEDFVVEYRNSSGSVVDLYLTGDMPTVSVISDLKPFTETNCTFTSLEPVIIYNVLGEQVAVVSVENETIAPFQLEALPQGALWAVQGECVRRVR